MQERKTEVIGEFSGLGLEGIRSQSCSFLSYTTNSRNNSDS